MADPSNLPTGKNYITTHTDTGSSIFTTEIADTPKYKTLPKTETMFADLHHALEIPVSLSTDITATQNLIQTNTIISKAFPGPNVVFRRTDTPPGGVSPMHRTITVDYGIVLEGEVILTLESGEERTLRKGDTVVQRATMHSWRNGSETEWCRMIFVMMPAEPLSFGGMELREEFRFSSER